MLQANVDTVTGMQSTEPIAALQRAWIDLTRRAHLPSVEERLRRDAGTDLALPAFAVLGRLDNQGPLQISELATLGGVDISTMSRTLRHLCDDGYVQRERGEDLRCVVMQITQRGRETVGRMQTASQQMLAHILSEWTDADRAELTRLLTRLADDFTRYADHSDQPGRQE
jgi:DNA-binding MarR family transcriptional regulator